MPKSLQRGFGKRIPGRFGRSGFTPSQIIKSIQGYREMTCLFEWMAPQRKEVGIPFPRILKHNKLVTTRGSRLLNGGKAELAQNIRRLESGGVLFIDKANQLNPRKYDIGSQVLDMLLQEMENKRESLVVIMAGYENQMDDVMAHNEGLSSYFPHHFSFDDFTDNELFAALRASIKEKPKFTVSDDKYTRIAIKRIGRQRGTVGFENYYS